MDNSAALANATEARRKVLDWRDRHLYRLQIQLRKDLLSLAREVRNRFREASSFDLYYRHEKFEKEQIRPLAHEEIEASIRAIIENAQTDLGQALRDWDGTRNVDGGVTLTLDRGAGATLLASTVGGTAGVAAATAATVSASTVSAGGIAGLLGATVVSWPVVLTGSAIGGVIALAARNGIKAARRKTIEEYVEQHRTKTEKMVLGSPGKETTSVAYHLSRHINQTAESIIKDIEHAWTDSV